MNKISYLPNHMHRQWKIFEDGLTGWLRSEGVSPQEIEYACEKIKPFYLEFAQPKSFSGGPDPDKVMAEINEWMYSLTMGLLQLIAVRDIELFRLRGYDDHE